MRTGVCPVIIIAVCLLFIASSGMAVERWLPVGGVGEPLEPVARIISSDPSSIVILVELSGLFSQEMETESGSFAGVRLPGHGFTTEIGKARLPVIREMVQIPLGAEVGVEVMDVEGAEFALEDLGISHRIIPVRPSVTKIPEAHEELIIDEDFYRQDVFVPGDVARVGSTGSIRGHRFALVEVFPASYNPAKGRLKICSRIELCLHLDGSDMEATERQIRRYASPPFEALCQQTFLNYDEYRPKASGMPMLPICYLIIAVDDYLDALQPLIDWKVKRGFHVVVAPTSEVGSTTSDIEQYIWEAYQEWPIPPTYVLFVGDVPLLPCFNQISGTPTDLYYTTIDGGNYFPDVQIGRLSVTDTIETATLVEKIVDYERADWESEPGWTKRAYFMASNDGTYHGVAEGTHLYSMAIARANGMICDSLFAYYGTGTPIATAVNQGRSLVIYSGHGSTYGWGGPSFSQSNVRSLMNLDMYPLVCSHACETGDFTASECFGETWIRVANKGAIAFWGSSVNSQWPEDDILQKRMFDALFDSSFTWLAGMMDKAKIDLFAYYGGGGRSQAYFEQYNLLGDPSMELFTDIPGELTVCYPPILPIGATEFTVSVSDNGGPVDGALVALSMGGAVYGTAYSSLGMAAVPLDPAPEQTGIMAVTVTKYNRIPHEGITRVAVPASVAMEPESVEVEDTTPVTITVQDTLGQGIEDVKITIVGWGLEQVDTTDGDGRVVMDVFAPYGEVLEVVGRRIGEFYDLFSEELPVYGALPPPQADVFGQVPKGGMADTLIFNYEGIVVGQCDESGFALYVRGAGVDTMVTGSSTAEISVVPTLIGTIDAAIGKAGHQIYQETIPVILMGGIAGRVDLAESEDDGGVVVTAVGEGQFTFQDTTSPDGLYLILGLPDGPYQVTAFKAGYGDSTIEEVVVSGKTVANQVDFTLYPYRLFYYCNFNYEYQQFTADGDDQWEWGEPGQGPMAAHSEPGVWGTRIAGTYENNANAWLDSPVLDLRGSYRAELAFWHWYEFEGTFIYYDGGNVKLSMDGGPFELIVPREGYDGIISQNNAGIPQEPGYATPAMGNFWHQEVFDLTPFVGHLVQIRFHFGSDNIVSSYAGWYVDDVQVWNIPGVAVEEGRDRLPTTYSLSQNFPNPFNPATEIGFALPRSGRVTLSIYNVLGQRVETLVDGEMKAGRHRVRWEPKGLSSGVYLYRLEAGDYTSVQKMVMMK